MKGPKVVLLGAGSLFFGRQAIWQMVQSEFLREGTLALVDTDPVHLARMTSLAQKVVAHGHSPLRIETATDRREVLKGADFVVLSFADRSVHFRGVDCAVALKYGIRMCSGDTIGPGGIFRTLREFPQILAACGDIADLAPEAWVINYINPTAANGIGLRLFAPKLKSFALCDGLHMPHIKRLYAERAGLLKEGQPLSADVDRRFDMCIAGVNHFTWLLKAAHDGRDVSPAIAEFLRLQAGRESVGGDRGAKALHNETIGYDLYKAFGCIPTCVAHTKEYVRFYQGLGINPSAVPPLSIWETADRYERHAAMWRQVDGFVLGATPMKEYVSAFGPDHATDIIETMWAGLTKPFYVNTANQGTVTNMPSDAFLELLCDLDMQGPRPRPVGPAPVGLRGLWQQVLDAHELSVRAAVTCDRGLLERAFACDPLSVNLADCREMISELLQVERDALPAGWFPR